MVYKTIILTGVPRSGSSLSCNILNHFENTLALLEPMRVFESDPAKGKIQACKDVCNFVFESRKKVVYDEKVVTGTINGEILSNTFELSVQNGLRKAIVKNREINMQRDDISKNFTLLLKHPAFFSAILDDLINFFEVYATIRNPLSILASWQTIDVAINRGYIPAGQRFDSDLDNKLNNTSDRLERQMIIINWFFKRYYNYLDSSHIIRYEDVIESNGEIFKPLSYNGIAHQSIAPLNSQNSNKAYINVDIDKLYNAIMKKKDAFYWHYYTPTDIETTYRVLKLNLFL